MPRLVRMYSSVTSISRRSASTAHFTPSMTEGDPSKQTRTFMFTTIDSIESHDVFDVEQEITKYERRHGRRERNFYPSHPSHAHPVRLRSEEHSSELQSR